MVALLEMGQALSPPCCAAHNDDFDREDQIRKERDDAETERQRKKAEEEAAMTLSPLERETAAMVAMTNCEHALSSCPTHSHVPPQSPRRK